MDDKGRVELVIQNTQDSWDEQLQLLNDSFELHLKIVDELNVFNGKMH